MKHGHTSIKPDEPLVGCWYDSEDFHECFKVVALDKHGCVEIQYFDGDIEELDIDTWMSMHPHEIPEPEDASAPYEMDREDILNLINESENETDLDQYLDHLDQDDY